MGSGGERQGSDPAADSGQATPSQTLAALQLASDRRLAMAAVGLSLIPVLWYVRTDVALYAGQWSDLAPRLLARASLVIASVLALWRLQSVATRAQYSSTILAYALCVSTLVVVLNALRPQGSTLPLRMPLYVLFVLYAALPNAIWRQLAPPFLLSGGLILLRLTLMTSDAGSDVAGDVLIIVILNALGVLFVRRRLALERDVEARAQAERLALEVARQSLAELKTLRGIVPICAHCKKVRTELGDWQQLEQYVSANSHAEFSHGVCPVCLEDHYGTDLRRTSPTG